MHILDICQYFPPEMGAPAARAYEFSRRWAAAGHRVTVLCGVPNHLTGVLYPGYREGMAAVELGAGGALMRLLRGIERFTTAGGLFYGQNHEVPTVGTKLHRNAESPAYRREIRSDMLTMAVRLVVFLLLGVGGATAQTQMYPVSGNCGYVTANAVASLPPYSPAMPAEVRAAYGRIDSLCREKYPYDVLPWLSVLSGAMVDELLQLYKRIREYDPILWHEYYNAAAWSSAYRTNPRQFIEFCFDADERLHQHVISAAGEKLIASSYIYHVRIERRSSSMDTTRRAIYEQFCSEALVLRRFKGEVVPDSRECDDDADRYILIEWASRLPGRGDAIVVDWDRYRKSREEYLNPGAEFLVILDLWLVRLDDGERAYQLVLTGSHCNLTPSVFPIQNGMIIDDENVFKLGCAIPLEVFQQYERSFREIIREPTCPM
ncbi:MAG: hypothetical protein WC824_15720 [Bacteroidota bacterium]|jgi:hypothetical protein